MTAADVLVVGAGPGGNRAAAALAGLGYQVIVLESRAKIGDKLCTGIVGKDCLARFAAAQPAIYRDLSAATFVLPSGKTIRFDMGRPYAHVIDRVGFVASLAQKAQESGAVYPPNRKVSRVEAGRDGVRVRALSGEREELYTARALVLASGFGSVFTRSLGLGSVGDFALGAQAEVVTGGLEETELFLGRRHAPGFFAWLVPTQGGRALVGLMARRDPEKHLKELMADFRSQNKIVSIVREPSKWGIPLRPPPRTYGDRVLVVGDAAGQVKPTTGGGIYYSLLCAEMAAETLHSALERDDLSAGRLKQYESRWKAKLGKELTVGFYARRFFEALGDRQIEFLANTIASNGIHQDVVQGKLSSFDWHADLILKGIRHRAIRGVVHPLRALMPSIRWDQSR